MKRLFAIIILTMSLTANVRAEEKTLDFKFGDIKSITTVQSQVIPYEIHVTRGNSKDVKVVYDTEIGKNIEDFEKYIKVDYSSAGSTLILGMNELPRRFEKFRLRFRTSPIKVYIEMDEIDCLDLSGASSIRFDGNFSADSFEADISGAAKFINTLNISGKELNIECSGASELSLKGDFKEADIELSGAARFQCSGSHTSCTMECSGAAKIDMDGNTDTFELEGSGACNINAKGYHAKKAFVELSGACTAKVKVSDDLRHDVGTTCKLTYFGSPEITDMSQSKNVVQGKE